jgi:hypothetical protein
MAHEIKQLLGNRVYLEIPEVEESTVILDEESQRAKDAKQMKALDRLKVYAVGISIEHIKEGDEVMLDPSLDTKFVRIPISDTKTVALVPVFNIAHVW